MTNTTSRSSIAVVAFIVRLGTSILALMGLGLLLNSTAAVVLGVVGLALGLTHAICNEMANAYPNTAKGWFVLLVDHTWSLPNTIVGSVYLTLLLACGLRPKPQPQPNRVALMLGGNVVKGFVGTTLGPVEAHKSYAAEWAPPAPGSGGWSKEDASKEDESTNRHEYVHVFQARVFGPLYFPFVIAHYIVAAIVPYWLIYHDYATYPIDGPGAYFTDGVYRHVWNEEWAYAVAP